MSLSQAKIRNYAGAFLMGAFGVIAAWRFQQSGFLLFAMVSLRDFMGAFFLCRRDEAEVEGSLFERCLAYVSAGLPLLYVGHDGAVSPGIAGTANLLAIGGYGLATLAMIDLGKSFGVGPARRGVLVVTGVYRWVRHPMYVGYVFAEFGFVLAYSRNIPLLVLSAALYFIRAGREMRLRKALSVKSLA